MTAIPILVCDDDFYTQGGIVDLVVPSSAASLNGSVELIIMQDDDPSLPYLGPSSWQATEFRWQSGPTRARDGDTLVPLGERIAAQLEDFQTFRVVFPAHALEVVTVWQGVTSCSLGPNVSRVSDTRAAHSFVSLPSGAGGSQTSADEERRAAMAKEAEVAREAAEAEAERVEAARQAADKAEAETRARAEAETRARAEAFPATQPFVAVSAAPQSASHPPMANPTELSIPTHIPLAGAFAGGNPAYYPNGGALPMQPPVAGPASNNGRVLGVIGVLVLAAVGVGVFIATREDAPSTSTAPVAAVSNPKTGDQLSLNTATPMPSAAELHPQEAAAPDTTATALTTASSNLSESAAAPSKAALQVPSSRAAVPVAAVPVAAVPVATATPPVAAPSKGLSVTTAAAKMPRFPRVAPRNTGK